MYKIAICDDDKNYREKIEKVIETEGILPKSEIRFYEYESGKELLKNAHILHLYGYASARIGWEQIGTEAEAIQ